MEDPEVDYSHMLKTVPTQALISEALSRCSPAIFIGTRQEDGGKPTDFSDWVGRDEACYGLVQQVALEIQSQVIQRKVGELYE